MSSNRCTLPASADWQYITDSTQPEMSSQCQALGGCHTHAFKPKMYATVRKISDCPLHDAQMGLEDSRSAFPTIANRCKLKQEGQSCQVTS